MYTILKSLDNGYLLQVKYSRMNTPRCSSKTIHAIGTFYTVFYLAFYILNLNLNLHKIFLMLLFNVYIFCFIKYSVCKILFLKFQMLDIKPKYFNLVWILCSTLFKTIATDFTIRVNTFFPLFFFSESCVTWCRAGHVMAFFNSLVNCLLI